MVKWSACSPSTPTIRVRIPQFFSLGLVVSYCKLHASCFLDDYKRRFFTKLIYLIESWSVWITQQGISLCKIKHLMHLRKMKKRPGRAHFEKNLRISSPLLIEISIREALIAWHLTKRLSAKKIDWGNDDETFARLVDHKIRSFFTISRSKIR